MTDDSGLITKRVLLHEANKRELGVTADKLDRWVRRGLVPRPITRNLGGRLGQQSLYPAETIEQLAAVTDALAVDRRLDRAAFLVWWWGFEVEMTEVRQLLIKIAMDLDQEISVLRSAGEDGTIDQLIEESATARVRNRVMGRARRRVGRDAFPTVMRILLEIATGSFSGLYADYSTDEDESLLFEQALGLARARSDPLPDGSGPWLTSNPEENLHELSLIMSEPIPPVLQDTGDAELSMARDEIAPIVQVLAAAAPAVEAERGLGAYGITDFGRLLGEMTVSDLGQFFVLWLRLRVHPALKPGIVELGQAAREALAQAGRGVDLQNTT